MKLPCDVNFLRVMDCEKGPSLSFREHLYLLFLNYINDFLKCLFSITNRDCYNLRSNNCMLSSTKLNTHAIKKCFRYRASVIWNILHDEEKIIIR